jgi:hypothetical protein
MNVESYFSKPNLWCKLLKHKYTSDEIIVKGVGRDKFSINRYRYCKRCKITFKTYYGLYNRKTLDGHYACFGDIEKQIYDKYNEVNKC